MPEFIPLPGSDLPELPGAQPSGTLDPNAEITVTLVLRRRAEIPEELITGSQTITRAELAERYGASPGDIELALSVLAGYGLLVTAIYPGSRRLEVTGTISRLSVGRSLIK